MPPENNELATEELFEDYPSPPAELPEWAVRESLEWRRLGEFDLLAKAEEKTGLRREIKYEPLPAGV